MDGELRKQGTIDVETNPTSRPGIAVHPDGEWRDEYAV